MIGSIEIDRKAVPSLWLAGSSAVAIGILVAATSPLVSLAALIGCVLLAAILLRPMVGLLSFVAVIGIVPFGVIPVPIAGAQLTFVDAILLATFASVLARVVFGGWRITFGPPGLALIGFVLIAVAAFIGGSASYFPSPELIRRFGKLIVGLLMFLIAQAVLTTPARMTALTRALICAGAIQGAIGAGLMAFQPLTQLSVLSRLQVIGYPTDDVLRYVPGPNDTYTDQLRAIGTSVDPNVFGGTLMLAMALMVVQWSARAPVLPRAVLLCLAIPTAGGLLLSLSRASWLGLAAGLFLVGVLCYGRILVLGGVFGLLLLTTPIARDYVLRFISGFSTADRATAFRVGEYANALTLIERYPLLGIGFGLSPDIDVTAGVSSVYLLVAEQAGLLGLALYLLALATLWWTGFRALSNTRDDDPMRATRAAFLGAVTGALAAGLLDHYFANQAFPHVVALFWLYAAGLVAGARLGTSGDRQAEPERAAKPDAAARRAHRATV